MMNKILNRAPSATENLKLNLNYVCNNDVDSDNEIILCNSEFITLNECVSFLTINSTCKNFLHLNCRSLSKNFDSFSSLIAHIGIPFLALALTETWLKPHNEDIFKLSGYNFVSCSRPKKYGGGVGIYINSLEQYNILTDLTVISDTMECIFVEIVSQEGHNNNLIVGCIYRPPSTDIYAFNERLIEMLNRTCLCSNKEVVIMGDFNLDLLEHRTLKPSATFLNTMLSFGLLPTITRPSRVTDTTATLLDNIFTNLNIANCKSALIYENISDHYPVLLSYKTKGNNCQKSQPNFKRNFNHKSIEQFKLYCSNTANWNRLYLNWNGDTVDPNLVYEEFLQIFNHGFNICFPKGKVKINKRSPRKEWMTPGLAKSCETKSSLYKIYANNKTPENKLKFNVYRNKLKKVLNKAEKDFYSNQLNRNKNDPRKTWQCINSLLNNTKPNNNYQTKFNLNGTSITDNGSIAESFNDYFITIGNKLAEKIAQPQKSFSEYMPNKLKISNSCALHFTDPYEIIDIVRSMKNSSSAGIDEISTNILKSVIVYVAEPLSMIINASIVSGIFPDKMKTAKVCPILKSGPKNEFSNYRPISVLNSFSKIFEKVITKRLASFLELHNILSASQYGFRKKHSTYMAIMNFYDRVSNAIDNNEFCLGIFIDLSKAFDTLDHDILLAKLEIYGIRGVANNLIRSYLHNRQQYVVYNNSESSYKTITCGVPQGSILGPLLFLLYINDISYCSNILAFILFADDTNIICSNSNIWELMRTVNAELVILSDWFKANRLSLNIQKTSFMLFGFKHLSVRNIAEFCIQIDSINISKVEFTKFLGVIIDQKLTWKQHISYLALKLSKSIGILNRLKYKLPKRCLLTLYYSLVYPHLTYCNIIWGGACKTILKDLEVLQKRAVRIIAKSNYLSHTSNIFKELNLLKLFDINLHCCCLFVCKYILKELPNSCSNYLVLRDSSQLMYNFRDTSNFLLPAFRTKIRERSITIRGPRCWKTLPDCLATISSSKCFNAQFQRYIICAY